MLANKKSKMLPDHKPTEDADWQHQPQQIQPEVQTSINKVKQSLGHFIKALKPALFYNYLPSPRIASCVRTAGTVTWPLHLMWPCYVALGQVLIWVVCPDWFEELCQIYCTIKHTSCFSSWQWQYLILTQQRPDFFSEADAKALICQFVHIFSQLFTLYTT